MSISFYIKKVRESGHFKQFQKEDKKSYLCSIFFVRDFLEKKDETQVDFYSPAKKKIINFKITPEGIEKPEDKISETISHKEIIPEKLSENIKIDIDEIKGILEKEMKKKEIPNEIQKVLVYLSENNGKIVWNCTGFLKGLAMLNAVIEDSTSKAISIEKKSFFDMINFIGKKK
jgi:hypothetical protein